MEISDQDRRVLDHFQENMNIYDYESQEYELSRKVYAWKCNEIRRQNKLNEENNGQNN